MHAVPSYLKLHREGRLREIADRIERRMRGCDLCPRRCGVNRLEGETGACRSGARPLVASAQPHFGEEPSISGTRGSGTVFFANCNLGCIFCQNYDLSHLAQGREIGCEDLARAMLALQDRGCHNINLVSPTHMLHPILQALLAAVPLGLRLPLVYNSGGYDAAGALRLLDGVFDIYMPDFKYGDAGSGQRLSGVPDYPQRAREAVAEMHRQVGDLRVDERGVAFRGLLVRHLVLPEGLAGTWEVMSFLCGLSRDTCVNVMGQYHPAYRAREHPAMGRRPTRREVEEGVSLAREAGLRRVLR